MASNLDFLERINHYIRETGITYRQVERCGQWTRFGLPDMRGFTPHLRQVNLFRDQKRNSRLWLLHDVMHIIFYDFASLHLGREAWNDPCRFFENHLASEAFAVLGLDYHYLSKFPGKGLTVDFNKKDWSSFQKINPRLPHFTSFAFCKMLIDEYLSGKSQAFTLKKKVIGSEKYRNWLGHEIRYSQKQRHYVQIWFEDLWDLPQSKTEAIIENSRVDEAVWELLSLLTEKNGSSWVAYVKDVKRHRFPKNAFEDFPKYAKKRKNYDFRFTDVRSLKRSTVKALLADAQPPSSSLLFFFWQIISMVEPKELKATERQVLRHLAANVMTKHIDLELWSKAKETCSSIFSEAKWKEDPSAMATFFLP